jgi:poly(3-hydroxybutyrate) depolymerase
MKLKIAMVLGALTAVLMLVHAPVSAQAPEGKQGGGRGKGGGFTQDPRVQTRMYRFEDTDQDLPYSLYVSTKVTKDKKAPLVVTLHGLGATQTIMMTTAAVDLAEEGGYILVSPLGYNTGGWYGSPLLTGPGRGRGRALPPGVTPPPPPPANLSELSEKDVMNVIGMVRKEFNVDDKRIYLMGHSMGGAGTLFLGSKYASMWAAIGAEAPADFGMNNTRQEILQKMKDANLPVMIVQGDMDEAVPVTNTRMWVDTMKEMNLNYEYVEQPGISHGPVIQTGLKPIYEFFGKHTKK